LTVDELDEDDGTALDDVVKAMAVEIPAELFTRAEKHLQWLNQQAKRQGRRHVWRTEVLLRAYSEAYTHIDEVLAGAAEEQFDESELFGRREVRVAVSNGPTKRWQVRPKWGEYRRMAALGRSQRMKFTPFTVIVLSWYLGRQEESRRAS
jgi:hypothetical protein